MSRFSIIQLQTTSLCPGCCLICPYSQSWHKRNPGYMSDGDFKNVLEKIREYDSDFDGQFCPYLMQDGLADKKIIERIEKIFKYFPKAFVEISTNAMLLTPELSEKLINVILKYDKTNRSHIWISHHAVNEETYKKIMQRNNYKQTLQNIIDYLKINKGRVPTEIRSSGASRDGSMKFFTQEETNTYWSNIIKTNEIVIKNLSVIYFTFHNRAGNVHLGNWDGEEFFRLIDEYHPFNCWRYSSGLHIMYNSNVTCCCMNYSGEYIWGNLKEQSLKEIWDGEERQDFIDKATGLKKSEKEFICKKCIGVGG